MILKILLIIFAIVVLLFTCALLLVFKASGKITKEEEQKEYINKLKEKDNENH